MKNISEKIGLGIFLFAGLFSHPLNAQSFAKSEGADVHDAQFEGGHEQMNLFFAENMIYPEKAVARHIEGTVVVTFTVDSAGMVRNLKIRKALGHGCDEEAMRLVQTMPKWKPARLNGKPIATGKTLHIPFKMPYSADIRN